MEMKNAFIDVDFPVFSVIMGEHFAMINIIRGKSRTAEDRGESSVKAKIYTKTGDTGQTSLVGGKRVSKADARLEAYGTLDELNSFCGLLRAELAAVTDPLLRAQIDARLQSVQNNIFNIGSHLACEDQKLLESLPGLSAGLGGELEADMDRWESELPPLRHFILPGGSRAAALAHVNRVVCRRVERLVVRLREGGEPVEPAQIVFLNRLSDWFFLLARRLNAGASIGDVIWSQG